MVVIEPELEWEDKESSSTVNPTEYRVPDASEECGGCEDDSFEDALTPDQLKSNLNQQTMQKQKEISSLVGGSMKMLYRNMNFLCKLLLRFLYPH